MTDEFLHSLARETAALLRDPDKKQLRFNDIVDVARSHYSADPSAGVEELVWACDRVHAQLGDDGDPEVVPNQMYVKGKAMWQSLRDDYAWMSA